MTDDVVKRTIPGIHSFHHFLRPVATVLSKPSFVLGEGPWLADELMTTDRFISSDCLLDLRDDFSYHLHDFDSGANFAPPLNINGSSSKVGRLRECTLRTSMFWVLMSEEA
jgi:hypothetical protein